MLLESVNQAQSGQMNKNVETVLRLCFDRAGVKNSYADTFAKMPTFRCIGPLNTASAIEVLPQKLIAGVSTASPQGTALLL